MRGHLSNFFITQKTTLVHILTLDISLITILLSVHIQINYYRVILTCKLTQ